MLERKKKLFKRICYIFASCSAVANEQRAKAILFSFIAMDKKKMQIELNKLSLNVLD